MKAKKRKKKNYCVTEFGGRDKTKFIVQAYRRTLLAPPWLLKDYFVLLSKALSKFPGR